MLHYKDIAKLDDIKGKFNKVWFNSDYLQLHLNILGFKKIKSSFSWCKKSGYTFYDMISSLLIMPLIGAETIHRLTKSPSVDVQKRGKDSYYRILGNQKINCRSFLA